MTRGSCPSPGGTVIAWPSGVLMWFLPSSSLDADPDCRPALAILPGHWAVGRGAGVLRSPGGARSPAVRRQKSWLIGSTASVTPGRAARGCTRPTCRGPHSGSPRFPPRPRADRAPPAPQPPVRPRQPGPALPRGTSRGAPSDPAVHEDAPDYPGGRDHGCATSRNLTQTPDRTRHRIPRQWAGPQHERHRATDPTRVVPSEVHPQNGFIYARGTALGPALRLAALFAARPVGLPHPGARDLYRRRAEDRGRFPGPRPMPIPGGGRLRGPS